MKKLRNFSDLKQTHNEHESYIDSLSEGVVEELVKKLGFKDISELKKRKSLLGQIESIVKEIGKRDINITEEDTIDEIEKEIQSLDKDSELKKETKVSDKKHTRKILKFEEFVNENLTSGEFVTVLESRTRLTNEEILAKYSDISLDEGINPLLRQSKLSSIEYQKAKKLKDFNPDDYEWDGEQSLHIKKSLKEAKSGNKEEYQAFFKEKLKKFDVESPADLSEEDKKKFFNEIEKEWKGTNEALKESLKLSDLKVGETYKVYLNGWEVLEYVGMDNNNDHVFKPVFNVKFAPSSETILTHKQLINLMKDGSITESLNESVYPYQIDDTRGKKLYDKYDIALSDKKWNDNNNTGSDGYEDIFPLDAFLKKTKMTLKELKELESYTDESWGYYIDEDENLLKIFYS